MRLVREIKTAVSGHGHGCDCIACTEKYQVGEAAVDKTLVLRVAAAAVLVAAAWIMNASLPSASLLLAILSMLTAACDRFIRAVSACMRRAERQEDLLMFIAAIAAVAVGRPLEGAFGVILLQIGAVIQGHSRECARREIAELYPDGVTQHSSRAEAFIARFARIYTPIIMGIALVIAVIFPAVFHSTVRDGVYRALVLLVIACPCALTVCVPLTYFAGAGAMARHGVFVRETRTEAVLCRVSTAVFDQKSTLEGEGLRVVSVKSERMEAEVMLRIAAHACAYSDGVFARAVKAAYQDTIYIELIQSFWQEPERGITVEVDNVSIILGVLDFVRDHGVDPGEDAVPELSVYLAIDGKYAGRILLGRVPKSDAAASISALSWDKDRSVVMLSDESTSAAEKFARSAGIGRYYAECTPARKGEIVADLALRSGKNDALLYAGALPSDAACFAAADVGLSSMENAMQADMSAKEPGPSAVRRAIACAMRTRKILRQNVIGALAFKILVLGLDMLGVCPLWLAVFSDAGVTLAATLNAMRALRAPAEIVSAE